MNAGILHSGSKALDRAESRNHGVEDPYAYVVSWGPIPTGVDINPSKKFASTRVLDYDVSGTSGYIFVAFRSDPDPYKEFQFSSIIWIHSK